MKIALLGATGSIGTSTLAVVRENPGRLRVESMSCGRRIDLLIDRIREFQPSRVSVAGTAVAELKTLLATEPNPPEIFVNEDGGNTALIESADVDLVMAAMSGVDGVTSIFKALRLGKTVALANKEPMVLAGETLMRTMRDSGAHLLPADSEHNAIFQCLAGNRAADLSGITLTASGGPFHSEGDFERITTAQALRHPNWSMGEKITVDSVTMMNKALEIIEARWLFDLPPEKIAVVTHPQSVIHSMAHFIDGSTICQMGQPDMRVPIAFCLGLGERLPSGVGEPDWAALSPLEFFPPDHNRFPSLDFAYRVLRLGGDAPAMLNGADEYLVRAFLREEISLRRLFEILAELMRNLERDRHTGSRTAISIEQALRSNEQGADFARDRIN